MMQLHAPLRTGLTRLIRPVASLAAGSALVASCGCKETPTPKPLDNTAYVAVRQEEPPPATFALPTFVDVTQEAGIRFRHHNGAFGRKWMPETIGGGAGFFDYDADGAADILLVNGDDWPGHGSEGGPHTPALFRNLGNGRFEDVTAKAGLDQVRFYGMGFCAADYDADGDADLFLTGVGKNFLLRNEEGVYHDVTATHLERDPESQLEGASPDWSLSAAWFDADQDQDLDLFVTNYVNWTPETDVYTTLDGVTKSYATPRVYSGQTSRLFSNAGDGRLVEVTKAAGLLNPHGKSMGVVVDDFDSDGKLDLFVTNDTEPNFLYLNRGGRFQNVALEWGCGYDEDGRARAGMGVDTADLRNAGDLTIAIGNFSREAVSLYQRMGSPQSRVFVDAAGRARISKPTLLALTFGMRFADFDLDGFADLVLANGHIEPEIEAVQAEIKFAQKPQLFRNTATGAFEEVTDRVGEAFAAPMVARAVASADFDLDGDLDLLFGVNAGAPVLLRNDCAPGAHSIRVRCIGDAPNRDALGAIIRVKTDATKQDVRIRTGGSYLAQSELTATIGLGKADAASVEIVWPDGRTELLGELPAGYTYEVVRGKGVAERKAFQGRPAVAGDALPATAMTGLQGSNGR